MLARKPFVYRVVFTYDYNRDIELSVPISTPDAPWDVRDDYEVIVDDAVDELANNTMEVGDFTVTRIICGGMVVAEF